MSLQHIADHVRQHGRGEDTMLIHITPGELNGLQALAVSHGGSLTTNPKTGLPEAGFLSQLLGTVLPMIAGVALTPFTGPFGASLAVGAGSTLITGSLNKGLMAGLGAYGGAGLASGAAKLGAGAAGAAEAAAAGGSAAAAGQAAGRSAATTGLDVAAANAAAAKTAEQAARTAASGAFPSQANLAAAATTGTRGIASGIPMSGQAASQAAGQVTQQAAKAAPGFFEAGMAQYPAMQRGLGMAVKNPGAFVEATGGPMSTAMYGGAAVAPALLGSVDLNKRRMPGYDDSRDQGPDIALSDNFFASPIYSGGSIPIQYPYGTTFNQGGLTSLGAYSDGGQLVAGPGDGMSDHVPAVIGGRQAARLSPDEFVVPADVVSGIGNGSSKAGAAKLYDMMDKVRVARTGSAKQGRQINPDRMMPT